ncbi:MAG: hypothetical protein YK1309IOTA_350014 [Marine Group I thaumarchaeote]|nr:MAG: hypothetical protein YK1309IOTA_350014 [Marine Group I thaumarchaeote]
MLLGKGDDANKKDVIKNPYLFFRKVATVSRLDFLSSPKNLRKNLLKYIKADLPINDPVAPTNARIIGSNEESAE